MDTYNSVVALIPMELRDDANRLWRWLGRDGAPDPGASFNGPRMSKTGKEPATWGGFHDWSVTLPDLNAWLEMKRTGVLPTCIGNWVAPPLVEYDLSQQRAERVIAGLHLAVNHGWMTPSAFFDAVREINGLLLIEADV